MLRHLFPTRQPLLSLSLLARAIGVCPGPSVRASLTTASQVTASAAQPEAVEDLEVLHQGAEGHIDFNQHPLPFNDVQEAFHGRSTPELLRTLCVLSACQIKPLVGNADAILKATKRVFGSRLVNWGVRHTFFQQFCGGVDQDDMRPTLDFLARNGVGSILDYAAEDDVNAEDGPASRSNQHNTVVARTYNYDTEDACDRHLKIFLHSIKAAGDAPGQGFAAIKLTALGNPQLLERISAGLLALQNLFRTFDENLDNVISRDEFTHTYSELFSDATPERIESLFKYLDKDNTGVVDYLSWHRAIRLQDVPAIIKYCKAPGPVYLSALTEEELSLLDNMMQRLYTVGDAAAEANVKLMIDAEHTYFQPAIDHAAMELQRKFNLKEAFIYNTYQCYLKDTHDRMLLDMERARREGYVFAAKLVRGAYMYLERDRAKERGYPSPIQDTLKDTHANYNRCMDACLKGVAEDGFEVMVASHNKVSMERAVILMKHMGLDPPSEQHVYFGQLLGMADPVTFVLGRHGYRAYKYVPFGKVDEVIPYLLRRAQENSDMLGGVGAEVAMLKAELRSRLFGRATPLPPAAHSPVRAAKSN